MLHEFLAQTGANANAPFQYGFTKEGVYTIEIKASGTHSIDGLQTDTATYTFLVGDHTVVPEPATLLLCASAVVGAFPWWLRRRRQDKRTVQSGRPSWGRLIQPRATIRPTSGSPANARASTVTRHRLRNSMVRLA